MAGREQLLCQSDPRTSCVIPVSTPTAKRLATVHLYLHPSSGDTKYSGAMRVGFFNGSETAVHESKVDVLVKATDGPYNVSVTDLVTPVQALTTFSLL